MSERFNPEDFNLPTPEELAKGFEDINWEAICKKLAEGGETTNHRILDENGEEKPATLMEWALWMEQGGRQIAFDKIEDHEVSTIFMGLDHGYAPGRHLWYETMVFGPAVPTEIFGKIRPIRPSFWADRCETKEQALAMHKEGKQWLETYLHERQTIQVRRKDQVDDSGERSE